MPRVFWMKMSCKKVFSMTYFIQINFIKNDLNKNVLNKRGEEDALLLTLDSLYE